MRLQWACVGLVLVACTPTHNAATFPSAPPQESSSPAVVAPTPPATPRASKATLPEPFPLPSGLLDGGAVRVASRIADLTGGDPTLKLDLTEVSLTITVVTPAGLATAYRWQEGQITQVESDIEYLGQRTFNPLDFPLREASRLFDIASLMGAGPGKRLQIVQFGEQEVYMSVATIPETTTVFFRRDGTAVLELSYSGAADIRQGLDEVVDGAAEVTALGFGAETGYYADLLSVDGVVTRRTRTGRLPPFASHRQAPIAWEPFDPSSVDPETISLTLAKLDEGSGGCSVAVDRRHQRVAPVVTYSCPSGTYYSDLHGRDMTDQLDG